MKNRIIKGSLIGLTAGLVATLFDSLYMVLLRETYVPSKYPILIMITNIFLWTIFGSVSGFFLYLFTRKKQNFQVKENYYWGILFLLPFALLFGLLGKFNDKQILHPGFDNNLVFLWVIIFIISVIAIKKRFPRAEVGGGFFILELFTITALFHFCSNINQLTAVQEIFSYFITVDFFKDNARWTHLYNRFCLIMYSVGTLLIVSLYCLASSKFKISRIKLVPLLIGLFLTAAVLLTVSYGTNRTAFLKQYHAFAGMQSQQTNKKVQSVILIVLDTVRKRSLDEYTKFYINLNTFAQDSVVFEHCIANAPWTIPSHASLFTGFSPREHGSHGILESSPYFDGFPFPRPLSDEFVTLTEVFRANGYRTAAIVSNFMALNPGYKLNQGFQIYDWSKSIGCAYEGLSIKPLLHLIAFVTNFKNEYTLSYRKAKDINDSVYYLLQRLVPNPFFLFLNYMDAHEPYRPSRPFNAFFLESLFPNIYSLAKWDGHFIHLVSKKSACITTKSLYAGEMAYLDYHLGDLFNRLKQMGIYDDSLIIVTSDHGEMFCEHGNVRHKVPLPLYDEILRIPLYIKFPHKQITGTKKQFITLADLYPTILSACSLAVPEEISSKPFGKTSKPVVAEFYNYDTGAQRTIYKGKHKFIQYEKGREPELYDLETDSLETNNIAKVFPETTANMENMMTEWVKNHPPRYQAADIQKEEVSPNVKEDLKALGYIQ